MAERSRLMAYPATFDVQPPQEFDKAQVALRVLIVVVLVLLIAIALIIDSMKRRRGIR